MALIQEDRLAQRASHYFFEKTGVAPNIKQFEARRAPSKRIYPPDYVDLFYLYTYIRAKKPQRVLEYGSGVSTLVIGIALEQNGGDGRLVSLEPSEDWARATRDALPGRLAKRAEVMYSRGVSCELNDKTTMRFADVPLADPDMIYIDGAPEGARYAGAENLAFLEENFGSREVAIFIDARRDALRYFDIPARAERFEVTSYAVDIVDLHSGKLLGSPFGLDQFSNSMVRWLGA